MHLAGRIHSLTHSEDCRGHRESHRMVARARGEIAGRPAVGGCSREDVGTILAP